MVVKIPAQKVPGTSSHQSDGLVLGKATKRHLSVELDEDNTETVDVEFLRPSSGKRPAFKRSRTGDSPRADNTDVDVDMDYASPGGPSTSSAPSITQNSNAESKHRFSYGMNKNKRVVSSDEEDEYNDREDSSHKGVSADYEEDDIQETRARKSPKPKNTMKGKGKGAVKAPKGKAPTAKKDVNKKEVKKRPPARKPPAEDEGAAVKKRAVRDASGEHANVDLLGESVTPHPVPTPVENPKPAKESAMSALPKMKKLPQIKKVKQVAGSGPGTPSQPSKTVSVADSAADDANQPSLPVGPRKPAATVGHADFDLRNASVYAELFKTAGGAPGSATRREKDEERRKELNKMRDDARAKRDADAKHTFNLQAQHDKIQRFGERLRVEKSSALYPNFLAAKFKDEYERARHERREPA